MLRVRSKRYTLIGVAVVTLFLFLSAGCGGGDSGSKWNICKNGNNIGCNGYSGDAAEQFCGMLCNAGGYSDSKVCDGCCFCGNPGSGSANVVGVGVGCSQTEE